ncbi:MAG: ABC transporter permease [Gammaproteobacteria bacterium]|nr:ABC transporter permease [Gammaproteobacteria bacterium]
MYKYIAKRLLLMIPTLFGAAVLVFCLMRLVPGDICEVKLAGEGAQVSAEQFDLCREELGLNDSAMAQFGKFIFGLVTFNPGDSMWTGKTIGHEIGLRFQLTLQLAVMTTIISVLIALPLGVISAIKQNTWVDYMVRTVAIAGVAIPSFWLGIMIILVMLIFTQYAFGAPWMPPVDFKPLWEDPMHNVSQLIWPALATGYRTSAVITRMTRSAMLEVLREDYIRTARAKGLVEQVVRIRHALKNAMLPVVTLIGIEFAFLIGGLVVTEQVFNLNGLGQLFVDSVGAHDYALTQALVMLVVFVFVMTNLFIDVVYGWLDPRIRYS